MDDYVCQVEDARIEPDEMIFNQERNILEGAIKWICLLASLAKIESKNTRDIMEIANKGVVLDIS